jgi:hypothetical protein
MQKIVIRVRGSLGLKLASDESEKGSAVSDTDSSATARVEDAETLNRSGLICAADAFIKTPHIKIATPAHTTASKRLRKAKALLLIGFALFGQSNPNKSTNEA